ncbi:cytochrome P450 6a9 [Musca domestica]|uniref:Cytochrome P450 6a9 n=2 Tax=Musca domestica TaxID=7370 RepID=C4PAX0_MUSDO|nr:cytochrome P450 6a9 [Musca domestica]ACR19216.1 cytochrome P450-6a40 [Musca domestica]
MWLSGILVGLVVTLISYLVLLMKRRLNYWHSRNVPCERPSLLLGNFKGMRTKYSFPEIWMNYYKKFKGSGPFAGFFWFSHPAVFVLDLELIKNILTRDFNKFMDRGFFHNEQDDPLTGHLFFLDGLKWKSLRQKLTPTFSSGKIAKMFPMVKNLTGRLMETMEEKLEDSEKQEDENAKHVLEMKDLLARFGTDVIGCCAFGIDCNSLSDPEAKFHIMGQRLFSEPRNGQLGNALAFNFPELVQKLHMKVIPDEISEFFMDLVKKTIQSREENPTERDDFLALLMELRESKQIKTEDGEETKSLTLEEIAAQIVLFFLAGYETSSTTVGFALYELARHQEIQNRLRQEVNEIWVKYGKDFTYESVKDMTYLQQVIQETLRLYIPVPVLNRKCLEDYPVPGHDEKYLIKKGMNVIIPVLAIQRDEEFFPQPEEFNPDNFEASRCKDRESVVYMPFGEGPRNCIGKRFGEMQTGLVLATLIKKFKFSTCPQTQIPVIFNKETYFLGAGHGIHLRVEKI